MAAGARVTAEAGERRGPRAVASRRAARSPLARPRPDHDLPSVPAAALDHNGGPAVAVAVAVADERRRVARDLHDGIAQSLAAVALELDRVVERTAPGDARHDLERLRRDLGCVVGEVRETLADLRADAGPDTGDLVATLDGLVGDLRRRTGLAVRTTYAADARLPPGQERQLAWIAREALANVARHADATTVAVTWHCRAGRALLEVVDDGRGFDTPSAPHPGRYGVLGMGERAAAIGADLTIETGAGRGTVVRCTIDPIQEARR